MTHRRVMHFGFALLLATACDSPSSGNSGAEQAKAEREAAKKALAEEAKATAEADQENAKTKEQVDALIEEATALMQEPSPEDALAQVEKGLALDPNNEKLTSLKKRLKDTLSRRCCGQWLRSENQGTSSKKDVRGILHSLELHKNRRDEKTRGSLRIACDSGRVQMSVDTPWSVPQRDAVTIKYTLGEEPQRLEVVTTQVSARSYTFQGPTKWIKKMAQNDGKQFVIEGPKNDGTQQTLKFSLGEVSLIAKAVLEACE